MKRHLKFTVGVFLLTSAAGFCQTPGGSPDQSGSDQNAVKPAIAARSAESNQKDYNEAIAEFRLGHLTVAAAKLRVLSAEMPDNATVHGILGYISIKQGAFAEAIPELEMAVKLLPNDRSARNNLGTAYLETGKLDEAIAQYRYVASHGKSDSRAHLNLANALAQAKRYEAAIPEYRRAIKDSPTTGAYKSLAFALEQAGKVEEAADANRRAARLSPGDADAWLNAGILYARAGDHVRAIGALMKAVALRTEYKFSAHVALADEYAVTGDIPAARKQYEYATRIKPSEFGPWYNLALLQARGGLKVEAIASYRKAVALRPADADALSGLGFLLASSGHGVEAAQLLKKADAIHPHIPGLHLALGNCARHANEEDGAIAEYQLALADNSLDNEARLALAVLFMSRKSFADAATEYDAAAKLEPKNAGVQNARALAHEALGQYDIALAALRLSIAANPKNARAWNNMGVVREKLGDKAQAAAAYKKATELDPKLAEARKNLSRVGAE